MLTLPIPFIPESADNTVVKTDLTVIGFSTREHVYKETLATIERAFRSLVASGMPHEDAALLVPTAFFARVLDAERLPFVNCSGCGKLIRIHPSVKAGFCFDCENNRRDGDS